MTKIFFDCEFTGLHQKTTLISIGFISDCGKEFYAEFDDFDKGKCNTWIKNNVLSELQFYKGHHQYEMETGDHSSYECIGGSKFIKGKLEKWLEEFGKVEIWSDCLSYDWVLFNDLMADYSNGYPELPKNVYYIPFDICTLFKIKEIDPDISREEFSGLTEGSNKHNALWDAKVIKRCYEKLMGVENE